ncbi:zf-HC2 domain-containing protein [Actinophytocola sp.]|uniref:anti-sigma factor n=1 Tax=Actinophytocola sp. TaxID=1872138 RepID=UPI002ED23FE8
MTGPAHDRAQLGAYAIGALDPVEARMVQGHLAGCADCQREVSELMMIRRALDQVPPEAFLDGPPESGDLLLRRTLRRVATEAGPPPRRSMTGLVVVGAAAAAVALVGGIFVGRETTGDAATAAPRTVTVEPSPTNARLAEATDPETGVTMNVALEPKKGWVWVHGTATGLPANTPCELWVIPKEGKPVSAGTWLVSEEGAKMSKMEGMALVAPDDVESIQIKTMSGKTEVTVPM